MTLSRIATHPLSLMITAVTLWMLYPPLVNGLIDTLGAFYVAAVAHTLAAVSMAVFAWFLVIAPSRRSATPVLSADHLARLSLPTLMSGVLISANHLLLYFALQASTQFDVLAILVFEAWPLLFFYFDSALRRESKSTTWKDFALVGAAFAGFLLLTASNYRPMEDGALSGSALMVMGLAGLGGLAMALNCYFRLRCMDTWQAISAEKGLDLDGFKLGVLTEAGVRSVAAPLLIGAFLLFGNTPLEMPMASLVLIGFVGFAILGMGSLLYDLAIYRANNAAIGALWYFMPIGAVLTLAVIEGRPLTLYEIAASTLIVGSNLLLGLRSAPSPEQATS
ncbi:hypothetical protein VRRI112168_02920 [Vreelandella rituensis]|uniref:EamA domain-containing protein n=1 Tax=Vreelandella rituensis TaxID=2282306 RepID=A0A368UD95_9GAMM|nr:hypothetical protein [Halomonas rituensis]RCV93693.1 hypothetical protein DU506_00640 [Halomonas rituensis]